jgi:hypothetical protein
VVVEYMTRRADGVERLCCALLARFHRQRGGRQGVVASIQG